MKVFLRVCFFALLALFAFFLWTRLSGPPAKISTSENDTPPPSSGPVPQEVARDQDPIVAQVGPLRIALSELLALSFPDEKGAVPTKSGETVLEVKKRIRQDNLEKMIKRRLLVLGSAAHPEWVSDASWEEEVQKELVAMGPEEIERKRKAIGLEKEAFLDQFRKHVREEMMKTEILRHEVVEKAPPTDEEVKARYDQDREAVYHRPNAWMVYQCVRVVTEESEADWKRAEEQAERIRSEASRAIETATDTVAQEDRLTALFKENANDLSLRYSRVLLYDVPQAKFDGAFMERVKQSQPGDLSPVFELAGDQDLEGYCFFLSESIIEGEYAPFERVQSSLKKKMTAENHERLENELFESLRQTYPVTTDEDLVYRDLESSSQEAGKP